MNGSGVYALLAVPFLLVALVLAVVAAVVADRRARTREDAARRRRVTAVTGVVAGVALLVMTIVFNNVIVTLRIVAYDPARITGLRIGAFPVEDLAYAVGAVLLLPSLWVLLDRDHRAELTTRPRPESEDPR